MDLLLQLPEKNFEAWFFFELGDITLDLLPPSRGEEDKRGEETRRHYPSLGLSSLGSLPSAKRAACGTKKAADQNGHNFPLQNGHTLKGSLGGGPSEALLKC